MDLYDILMVPYMPLTRDQSLLPAFSIFPPIHSGFVSNTYWQQVGFVSPIDIGLFIIKIIDETIIINLINISLILVY